MKPKRSGPFHGGITGLVIKGDNFLFCFFGLVQPSSEVCKLKHDPQRENYDVICTYSWTFLSFVTLRD